MASNQAINEERLDNSNLNFPVPPSIKKGDNPLMQRIRTTPPIQYSEAGELVKDVNVILVTVTDAEFRAVMGQAKPVGTENAEYHTIKLKDLTIFYLATYGKNKVAIVKTHQGARETRIVLDKVQKTLQAQYVIAVGICYGLNDKKVKLGDVIVSRKIVGISNKKAEEGSVVYRKSENKAGTLYNLFKMSAGFELCSSDGPENFVDIKPGVMVSESTLVTDQKYKDQILKLVPKALGGEMEGVGIMELAGENDFQLIIIKSVADWGDGNKEIRRKWQPFAAFAAAKYVQFHLDRNELRDPTKQSMPSLSSFGENHPLSTNQTYTTSAAQSMLPQQLVNAAEEEQMQVQTDIQENQQWRTDLHSQDLLPNDDHSGDETTRLLMTNPSSSTCQATTIDGAQPMSQQEINNQAQNVHYNQYYFRTTNVSSSQIVKINNVNVLNKASNKSSGTIKNKHFKKAFSVIITVVGSFFGLVSSVTGAIATGVCLADNNNNNSTSTSADCSNYVKIGVGIGGALFILTIIVVLIFLFCVIKLRKKYCRCLKD